ncbi:MAG: leucine-rich repeat domain-containing protein [Clostridia bacterium]|nr:leucine-rich repeat domain-containing protein [Clostridia bacterium]
MKQKKFVMLGLAMALVLLLPHAVFADAAKSGAVTDTISWELTDDGVLYIRGTGEIPDYGDFYKNGNRASDPAPWEALHDEIKELVIEEGITRIGERAFANNDIEDLYGYYNLTKVTLPSTLTGAGIDAFGGAAYYIEEVHAPSLLDWCEIAFEAETPGDPPIYESNPALYADLYVGNELLTGKVEFPKELKKVNTLTFADREGLTEVVLHDGVTELGECCFRESKDLRYVNLPDGLKEIPDDTFWGCESLESVAIPETVEAIGYAAFLDCKSLQSINIPAAVTKIEVGAFEGCDALNAVHITDLDAWCHIEFETFFHQHPHFDEGASPVRYAKNLYLNGELVTEVVVPDDVTVLSGSVFAGWESLQKVTLPEGLKTIGQAAFLGCTALTELRIPASVENVYVYAFGECTSLERLYIESPTLIGMELNSFSYEVIWKEVADRILVPDTYGETDVGTIFDGYAFKGKQDGYAVFEVCRHKQSEEIWQEDCTLLTRCANCKEVLESKTQHQEPAEEFADTEHCQLITRCPRCKIAYEIKAYHPQTVQIVTIEPTQISVGCAAERCAVCDVLLRMVSVPRLPKTEESSTVEESSTPEESSTAEESSAASSSAESSSMASLTETSVPADDTEFPVGIVIIVLLVLAAVGVSVWVVRKKL